QSGSNRRPARLSYLEVRRTLRPYASLSSSVRYHLFDECCPFAFVELRRRRGASGDRNSNFLEEFLLSSGRTNTEHAYGLIGSVVKLMRSVGRDVQRLAGAEGRLRAAESGLHLAFEENKGLLDSCRCGGGPPPGGICMSMTQKRPAVCSPVTVMV